MGYKLVNACVMLARFAGTSHNLSRIQVYASMTDSTKELISFYKDLDECIHDIPRKNILDTGMGGNYEKVWIWQMQ